MKALLLAAGIGSRLRPITNTTPKCLVPINGRPLLEIWLRQLSDFGVTEFFINTHHLSHRVQAFIQNSKWKNNVILYHEPELLGTLGTLISLREHFSENDFIVAHADNLCACNWQAFLLSHQNRPENCLMTMMLFETRAPQQCGIVELDTKGRVVKMHEKVIDPPGNLANAAIFLMSKKLIETLPAQSERVLEISTDLIPNLLGQIFSWKCDGYNRDIGTPESYRRAQSEFPGIALLP